MSVTLFAARPLAQEWMPDAEQHRRNIARVTNQAMNGLVNTTMSVTLEAGAVTTTVIDPRISIQTCVVLSPTTANAAAALATTYALCVAGQAVIHHANNAQTDRTFIMGIMG